MSENRTKIAYGRFITDLQTKYNLNNLSKRLGIKNVSDEYHCTALYSTGDVDRLLKYSPSLQFPLVADVVGFDLLGEEKNCLVLKLEHPDLHNVFNELKGLGAVWKWDNYTPHVTLTYNYKGELPTKLPRFKIKLTGFKSEESYDEYDPTDAQITLEESRLDKFNEALSKSKVIAFASQFRNSGKVKDSIKLNTEKSTKAFEINDLLHQVVKVAFPTFYQLHKLDLERVDKDNRIVIRPTNKRDGLLGEYSYEEDTLTLYNPDL